MSPPAGGEKARQAENDEMIKDSVLPIKTTYSA